MDSKLARWCNGFIEAGWLAAVITAPLFFNIHSERVFEPDKLTLVRSLAVMMIMAWIVRFVEQQGWRDLSWLDPRRENSIWRMPLVLPVVGLVVVYLLSTVFSLVPRVSWFGSYQRLQGTYTTLSYIVIFALTIATLRRREQVNRLVTTVIVTSIPIALYGMIQHFGLDPLPWGGDVQRRVAGHMGNAIFIAAYLIMAVPLTLARIIDAFTNILSEDEFSYADVIRSSIYIFTLATQLMAIYWSGSRGPLLGLIVGIFAFILILLVSLRDAATGEVRFRLVDAAWAFTLVIGGMALTFFLLLLLANALVGGSLASLVAFVGALGVVALAIFVLLAARRGWRWLWLSWILLTIVVGGWLALFNVPESQAAALEDTPVVGNVLATMAEWRELPTIGRFGTILESEGGTGLVRVLIWRGALELLAPHDPLSYPDDSTDTWNFLRPVFGYGPESMYVAYNSFYQPELADIEARNASPDRSHNETFDALIITGGAGFLVWQLLYLSVFYYGFRWLGVIKTGRDRFAFVSLWVAGATIAAITISLQLGTEFLGVAIPFGSVAGLVGYLIYYALFSRATEQAVQDPFYVDRLLMMGLLAAVVAHYVEIHFGIAIAATRIHFFVYVAMMFLVGYLLPKIGESWAETTAETVTEPAGRKGSRRRGSRGVSRPRPVWFGPVVAATFVLALIIGIMGYDFTNYVVQGELASIEDVPSALEIMHQSYLVNAGQEFSASPFVFLMIVLTWGLGTLLFVSEMAKQGQLQIRIAAGRVLEQNQQRIPLILFALQAVAALVAGIWTRFGSGTAPAGNTTGLLGIVLLMAWGILCLVAVYMLATRRDSAHRYSVIVALIGFSFGLPILAAQSWWVALALLALNGLALYYLWDDAWRNDLLPAGVIAITSWAVGFFYAFLHASLLRSSFIGPSGEVSSEVERQVLSTGGFTALLTFFYLFLFTLIILAAFGLMMGDTRPLTGSGAKSSGSVAGYVTLVVVFILGFFLINTTNLSVIQADIVYKRARPLERIARRQGTPESWEFPIAIYEHAIELAPWEDFYYLFLGAAYLEQSGRTQDEAAQTALLETARDRLLRAQEINPLNTDHTANLARLTTRWAAFSDRGTAQYDELVESAKGYYESALELSPRNSTIRNEYANLLLTMAGDCDAALEAYERSLELDPSYNVTYFGLAGAFQTCAPQQTEEEQIAFFRRAAELVLAGLEAGQSPNAGAYTYQVATLYRQAGDYELALQTLDDLRLLNDPAVPTWQIDMETARVFRNMEDLEAAIDQARQALETAPAEEQATIQQFIDAVSAQMLEG